MKKILRLYLPLFLTIIALSLFTLRYLMVNHSPVLKYFVREGKIISPAKNAIIKIDGVESPDSNIFESDGKFYFLTKDNKLPYDLLIIDKAKNDVALPNSGCGDVLLSNYLFLADCGYGGIFLSDKVKMEGFNTQLKISDSGVNFILPDTKNFVDPKYKIEILY